MSNVPPAMSEGIPPFDYQKMQVQLIGSLNTVAEAMRNCAAVYEGFAQMVAHTPAPFSPTALQAHMNGFAMAMAPPTTPAPDGKRKRGSADNGTEKKKRAPKDPNAPKRPASSYLLFQNDVRHELKLKNPTLPNNELLGVISKLWQELPAEQKQVYNDRQRVAKDKWLVDKSTYEAGEHDIASASPAALTAAPAQVVPAPAAPEVESSSEEESEEDTGSSSEDSSSESEKEQELPVKKKSKRVTPALAPAVTPLKVDPPVKEKKHKKSKA